MTELREAAFRTTPFVVASGPHSYVFAHHPASQWALAATSDRYQQIVALVHPDHQQMLLDDVQHGRLTGAALARLANDAVAEAAGRPWWEAARLSATALEPSGRMLGTLLLAGIRPQETTFAAFCCAVWARLTQGADATELFKMEAQLSVPPPGEETDEWGDAGFAGQVEALRAMPGVRIG